MANDAPRLIIENHFTWDEAQVENVRGSLELGALKLVVHVFGSFQCHIRR